MFEQIIVYFGFKTVDILDLLDTEAVICHEGEKATVCSVLNISVGCDCGRRKNNMLAGFSILNKKF